MAYEQHHPPVHRSPILKSKHPPAGRQCKFWFTGAIHKNRKNFQQDRDHSFRNRGNNGCRDNFNGRNGSGVQSDGIGNFVIKGCGNNLGYDHNLETVNRSNDRNSGNFSPLRNSNRRFNNGGQGQLN